MTQFGQPAERAVQDVAGRYQIPQFFKQPLISMRSPKEAGCNVTFSGMSQVPRAIRFAFVMRQSVLCSRLAEAGRCDTLLENSGREA
jgi:hypothetical protein